VVLPMACLKDETRAPRRLPLKVRGCGKRVQRSHATFGDVREHWPPCLLALCRSHVCYGRLPAMPPSRPYPKGHAAALTQMFALWTSCSLCARGIRPSKRGDGRAGAIGRRSNAGVLGRAMRKCVSCGRKISTKAKTCLQCGHPYELISVLGSPRLCFAIRHLTEQVMASERAASDRC
jgi:hypothetical protein